MTSTIDENIGKNLEKMRGDMSMDMLAAKMRERGHRWTKTTVFNTEHGTRQLRLSEATDVVKCLGTDSMEGINPLLYSKDEAGFMQVMSNVSEYGDKVLDYWSVLEMNREGLAKYMDRTPGLDESRIGTALFVLKDTTPEIMLKRHLLSVITEHLQKTAEYAEYEKAFKDGSIPKNPEEWSIDHYKKAIGDLLDSYQDESTDGRSDSVHAAMNDLTALTDLQHKAMHD
ncbi:MAG: hypothetical protein LKF41_02690 [Bifidobacterium sp.]|jgi:hypothetical protein|nr:hypothetical protein [Bifidobacterium sp.]